MTDEIQMSSFRPELSDSAAEQMLLAIRRSTREPVARPSTDAVVRFLARVVPAHQAALVLEAAALYPDVRLSLVSTLYELDILEALPWNATDDAVREGRVRADVAAAWSTLRYEQVSRAGPEPARVDDLANMLAKARDGIRDAVETVSRLHSFAAHWHRSLLHPGLATVRGNTAPETVGAGAPHVEILEAQIDSQGTLTAVGTLRPEGIQPKTEPVHLGLALGAVAQPIGSAVPDRGQVRWVVENFGDMIGVRSVRVPPEALTARFDPPPWPTATAISLLAEVVDSDSGPTGRAAIIEVLGPVRFESSMLSAVVALPPPTRAGFAAHTLELSVALSRTARQYVGQWRVSEWPEAGQQSVERRIETRCPGCPDGVIESTALQARLRPI